MDGVLPGGPDCASAFGFGASCETGLWGWSGADVQAACPESCGACPIEGCMDAAAENYNPDATVDDGSCIILCNDPLALNYDSSCHIEENCCLYNPCQPVQSTSQAFYAIEMVLDEDGNELDSLYVITVFKGNACVGSTPWQGEITTVAVNGCQWLGQCY